MSEGNGRARRGLFIVAGAVFAVLSVSFGLMGQLYGHAHPALLAFIPLSVMCGLAAGFMLNVGFRRRGD